MTKDYFGFIEVFSALIWLMIILVYAFFVRNINRDKPHYKYYIPNVLFKLFFGLAFGTYYFMYYSDGGDTIAYWDGATKLHRLFAKDPLLYLEEMWINGQNKVISARFDVTTGFPPGWIYREDSGWFVTKVFSILSFFTYKGYWAATIICSFIFASISWRFYEMVLRWKNHNEFYGAIGFLFIPSVSFWCATVTKDFISICATLYIIHFLLKLFLKDEKANIWNFLFFILSVYLILQIRSVYLVAISAPLLFVVTAKTRTRLEKYQGFATFINFLLIGIFLVTVIGFLSSQGNVLQSYIDEAATINQDFAQNATYTGKKYDLGITDYSLFGMLKAMPAAIVAGIYRPFLWEALTPSLIIDGLQSIFLFWLTWRFFRDKNYKEKISKFRKNEFMMYLFYYSILMAFMAGFTGIIFGVLVRFKTAALPFFITILTFRLGLSDEQRKTEQDEQLEKEQIDSDVNTSAEWVRL